MDIKLHIKNATQADLATLRSILTGSDVSAKESPAKEEGPKAETVPKPPAKKVPAPPGKVVVDVDGRPWDKRIDSSGKTQLVKDGPSGKKGSWKLKKGVDKKTVDKVKAELLAAAKAE